MCRQRDTRMSSRYMIGAGAEVTSGFFDLIQEVQLDYKNIFRKKSQNAYMNLKINKQ